MMSKNDATGLGAEELTEEEKPEDTPKKNYE